MRVVFLFAFVVGGLFLAADAGSKELESYGPGPQDLKSEWLKLSPGNLMFSAASGIAIGIDVQNRSESSLWLKWSIGPAGSSACEGVTAIGPKASTQLSCARDSLAPDFDYPMTIEIFRDSALSNSAERASTQMKFHKKDVETVAGLQSASTLPRTYEHIAYKKKLSATTAMFGQVAGPPKEGTLTVSAQGVEWKDKKDTVTIPAEKIHSVESRKIGGRSTDVWLVIEYDENGATKMMAVQPSAFRGDGPESVPAIYTSLRAVVDKR